ncbi:MAG: class I SAM-dependent methyltransferase [Verrucomicrobia bacterium]|nr:class I SAM-dependent methyltransferase [Verrucomicrobiota bacterium]
MHSRTPRIAVLPGSRPAWWLGALALTLAAGSPAWAQLGARSTEQWLKTLESQNRVLRLKVDDVIASLKLPARAVVADIGAGAGAFTLPLAKAVAAGGRVYAVDIDQGLVDHIVKKAGEAKLANVQGVLGKFTDPALPARDVDLAFIYDVLHHIESRAEYLQHLAGYLKPGGRIAVIDFYPEIGPHRNEPALQTTKEQTRQWMAAAGLRIAAEYRLYDDKWFVVYAKL